MASIDVVRAGGTYTSALRTTITAVTGEPIAEMSVAPPLLISRTIADMRAMPRVTDSDRLTALAAAGELFATATLGGHGPEEYCQLQAAASGMPIGVARRTLDGVRAACTVTGFAERPAAALPWPPPPGVGIRWVRRGDVLAVHAPGNHPGTHTEWIQAIALGYRVVVRPSQRDPFTPFRLALALVEAGLGAHIAFLPTEHAAADKLIDCADAGLVYGGDPVVDRYRDSTRVLPQGPGRSKVLLTGEVDWHDHLDLLVDSVSGDAGVGCINASGIAAAHDPGGLLDALTQHLGELPILPAQHAEAVLAVKPLPEIRATADWLGTEFGLGDAAGRCVADLGDGTGVLRPLALTADGIADPAFGVEMGFPYVRVAPWHATDTPRDLGRTLVLTALTDDEPLVSACVDTPGIRNVYWGPHRTCLMHYGLPHDGSLTGFLMEAKTVAR